MSGEDPYAAPDAAVNDPVDSESPIRWKRIAGWGALIFAAIASIYVFSGMVDTRLVFYGIAIEVIATSIASFTLYLVFLHTTSRRHFLQLMYVFLTVQILGIVTGSALDIMLRLYDSSGDLISFVELGRSLLVCLLAYATWYTTTRKWTKKGVRFIYHSNK